MKKYKTIRQTMFPVLLVALVLPILLFALISMYRLYSSIHKDLDMQVESNLNKEKQGLEMTLDKYATLMEDFSQDDGLLYFVSLVELEDQVEEPPADLLDEVRRRISSVCARNQEIAGITLHLKNGRSLFYDNLESTSTDSSWIDQVEAKSVSKKQNGIIRYDGLTEPVESRDGELYLFQVETELLHPDTGQVMGQAIFCIRESTMYNALDVGDNASVFLLQNDQVICAKDTAQIGKSSQELWQQGDRVDTLQHEDSGFTIINKQNLSVYRQTMLEQAIVLLLTMLVTVAIMITLLYYVTRPMIRQVDNIVSHMSQVQEGDFTVRMQVDDRMPGEFHRIGQGFNEMVAHTDYLIGQVKEAVVEQKNAELSALEAQIDPHFLYNTLDTINWKAIEKGEYEISELVGALADILRYSVKNSNERITLEQELYWLDRYIYLQKSRLGKPLETEITVSEHLKTCLIHKLLLQPFIENSIRHGLHEKEGDCYLKIAMKESGDQIHILIEDNGKGISPEQVAKLNRHQEESSSHIGVDNVFKRLELYYGDRADVYFESKPGRYTRVHLFLPIERRGEYL